MKQFEFQGQVFEHPLFQLFDYSDDQIKTSFHETRNWILQQILYNFDTLKKPNDVRNDKREYRKALKLRDEFERNLFKSTYEYICNQQPPLKYIWMMQISYLFTESIVESLCSIAKGVYTEKRRRIKPKKLKKILLNVMMLPKADAGRSKIVEWVRDKYVSKYGDGIIRNKWYLKKRQEKANISRSKVLDRQYNQRESIFVPHSFN